ncbi:MAG: hypothetical protein AABX73_01870 [Nanoarchaeota archaeon]
MLISIIIGVPLVVGIITLIIGEVRYSKIKNKLPPITERNRRYYQYQMFLFKPVFIGLIIGIILAVIMLTILPLIPIRILGDKTLLYSITLFLILAGAIIGWAIGKKNKS